jgi:cystinosin
MSAAALSAACGWVYFVTWSASFYPQLALNQRRRSVRGLSLDFVALNTTGFCAYALYTTLLYASPAAGTQFAAARGVLPQVPVNDVVFGVHGALLCCVAVAQCVVFPRGAQRVRPGVALGCGAAWAVMVGGGLAAAAGWLSWVRYLDACGGIKVLCSFGKYVPQVLFNWQRRSTAGFAALAMALDFTGGIFSLAQQALTASVLQSWVPFTRNVAKTFLAVETLFFDAVLLLQHFVLYPSVGGDGGEKKWEDAESPLMLCAGSPELAPGASTFANGGARSRSASFADGMLA